MNLGREVDEMSMFLKNQEGFRERTYPKGRESRTEKPGLAWSLERRPRLREHGLSSGLPPNAGIARAQGVAGLNRILNHRFT